MNLFVELFEHLTQIAPLDFLKMVIMWAIGGTLIFLAIKKEMEPTLLLPMGFGAILVNLPFSGAVTQIYDGLPKLVRLTCYLTRVLQMNCSR